MGLYTDKDGSKYIVTEFMSLGSLDQLLKANRNLELNVLLDMASQICLGMITLEAQNMVHRYWLKQRSLTL
jgi:serine/threonine protein kinase